MEKTAIERKTQGIICKWYEKEEFSTGMYMVMGVLQFHLESLPVKDGLRYEIVYPLKKMTSNQTAVKNFIDFSVCQLSHIYLPSKFLWTSK